MPSRLPEPIRQAMIRKGLKPNPSALAVHCGLTRMMTQRMFDGSSQHTALLQAVRIADALEMSVDDFVHVATTLDRTLMGDLIKGRLKRLGKSGYEFAKEISSGKHSGGIWAYTTGSVTYERLVAYATIASKLGLSLSRLCEILLMRRPLVSIEHDVTIASLSGVRVKSSLKLIA